jgi:hypothetical protein
MMGGFPIDFSTYKPVLDLSREVLLSAVLPAFGIKKPWTLANGDAFPRPRPRVRNHWSHLRQWHNFDQDGVNYWNQVSQTDKSALVESQSLLYMTRTTSSHSGAYVDQIIRDYHMSLHNSAATEVWHCPPPSDGHSRWAITEEVLAGSPEFVMYSMDGNKRVTALVSVKSPWEITPQDIDQVINGNFLALSS